MNERLKAEVTAIKNDAIANLDRLIKETISNLEKNGCKVHLVNSDKAALAKLNSIITGVKESNYVVKSKSNTISRVFGHGKPNAKIVETDLGDYIANMMGKKDVHPVLPAANLSAKEIAEKLSKMLGKKVAATPQAISQAVRGQLRDKIVNAKIGLTGANAVVSDGSIVLLENEGNISLVSRIPEMHIAVSGVEKIVATREDALKVVKAATSVGKTGAGNKNATYLSFISGPAKTADVEGKVVFGAQGPSEVHVILIDNRKDIPKEYADILKCINCGACINICPAYQVSPLGDQYKGIKFLAEDVLQGKIDCKMLYRCTTCKACEDVCPVGIKLRDIMLRLRENCVKDGKAPKELGEMIKNVRKTGNPFGDKRGKAEKMYCC